MGELALGPRIELADEKVPYTFSGQSGVRLLVIPRILGWSHQSPVAGSPICSEKYSTSSTNSQSLKQHWNSAKFEAKCLLEFRVTEIPTNVSKIPGSD